MTDKKKNEDIWAKAISDVRPLGKNASKASPSKPLEYVIRPPSGTKRPGRPKGPIHQSSFDPGLFRKIADGKVSLDKRLDLHGMTEARAHNILVDALEDAWGQGARRILVITGRGGARGGALRAMLPKWLSSPNLTPYVSSFTYADKRHGGDGAFYVLLRRLPEDFDQ